MRGTILVVDDTPDIADRLRGMLGSDGYRVLVAPTAAIGVQILRAFQVGLVVTDTLHAEDPDQGDPRAELDQLTAAAGDVPLILCAPDTSGLCADYAAHGFAACLTKPLDLDALRALAGSLFPGDASRPSVVGHPAPAVQG